MKTHTHTLTLDEMIDEDELIPKEPLTRGTGMRGNMHLEERRFKIKTYSPGKGVQENQVLPGGPVWTWWLGTAAGSPNLMAHGEGDGNTMGTAY